MIFFKILQKNALFVHYLTVIIVVVGLMSLFKMQREARPNVNFNRVGIAVGYPGASPSDIEELIIDPIEEKIEEVDGIEEFRSVSFAGAGAISIKIDDEYPDLDEVVDEIRRKVTGIKDLPAGIDDPVITEAKAVNIPILRMALFGSLPPETVKLEVEKFKDYLKKVTGVQSVNYSGLEDLQLKIAANPKKLNIHDVTLIEIIQSLQEWSKQKPGGLLENQNLTANLTIGSDYNAVKKLKNFVVRSNDSNRAVRLTSLADISYGLENTQTRSLYFDQQATLITVVKKPRADIVTTVDAVKKAIAVYGNNLPPELNIKLYQDEAKTVRDRMKAVSQNAFFGLALVLILLMVFLDWRSALVTSIGIPVAILGGIAIIFFLGNTLNSLVLVGMIVVLGMLVDDAIVVCENIFSYIEKGLSPSEAAIVGVREIAIPVVATVLTTICAFFPVLMMKGIMGQFISIIPLTVVAMLSVSLFEALVILPIHAQEIMKRSKTAKASAFAGLERFYRGYLKWCLKSRYIVVLVMLAFFTLTAIQGKQLFDRFTLFPATGLRGMNIRVELDKNTPIPTTTKMVQKLSKELETISEGSFDSVFASIGQVTTGGNSGSRQSASHLGQISVVFTTDPDFIYKEKRIVAATKIAAKAFSLKNNIKTSVSIDRPGPPVGKPIQIQIASRDIVFGGEIAHQITEKLNTIDGIQDIETDLDDGNIKYRFKVNNNLAVSEGVKPSDISNTIFAAATGRVTSEILKNNEKVEILVGLKASKFLDLKKILSLKVRNRNNQAVPLRTFARGIEEKGPSSIQRLNGLRTITLFGEVDEKIITGKEANKKIRPFIKKLQEDHPTLKIETGGGEKDRIAALQDTIRLYGLAILLIFMIISLSFRSMIYPFVVLLTIPMGLCGVVWALTFHGVPMSLMAIIGIVGLSGVVVNISIILMSYMQARINEGMAFFDAITEAGARRLRPIIITTLTTLIGLIPIMYGIGGVDTFVQPLALVLGWGLFVAAILSLLALPAFIALIPTLGKPQKISKN